MLSLFQIIVSLFLIFLILLQERAAGLGILAGGSGGTPYQTKRGLEKIIFWATIFLGLIFIALAILNLITQ